MFGIRFRQFYIRSFGFLDTQMSILRETAFWQDTFRVFQKCLKYRRLSETVFPSHNKTRF